MTRPMTVEFDVHIERRGRGARKELEEGPPPKPAVARTPRVSRLMALAHRFEKLIKQGVFDDYAAIAAAGHVTRARLSQIMSLLNLAPDIQEAILFLPRVEAG